MYSTKSASPYFIFNLLRDYISYTHCALPTYTKGWARELETEISPEEWHTSFMFTHKSSVCATFRKKKSKYCPDGTVIWLPLIGFFLIRLTFAGAVAARQAHIYMSGGSVTESAGLPSV